MLHHVVFILNLVAKIQFFLYDIFYRIHNTSKGIEYNTTTFSIGVATASQRLQILNSDTKTHCHRYNFKCTKISSYFYTINTL